MVFDSEYLHICNLCKSRGSQMVAVPTYVSKVVDLKPRLALCGFYSITTVRLKEHIISLPRPPEPFKRETAYLITGTTEGTGGVFSQ